jgi:ribose/xylose/arabinose/galactoside ABC-type transport system permease subunit
MTTRTLIDRAGVFIGLVLVALVFTALVGRQFLDPGNIELMARQMSIVAMSAIGMTAVIVAGGIDLSVGSVIALATVVIAVALRHDVSPFGAASLAVVVGAVCGLVNGILVTRLDVVPFIVTLGTMLVVRGAAKGLADERRVEAPMTWLNDMLRSPSGALALPSGLWLVAAAAVIVAILLQYTRIGRHIFAIGSNERMARLCGVPIDRTKVFVYALTGALAGLAGVLQFSKLAVGDPTVAVGLELDVIAAVIIGGGSLLGGRGTILGTLVGAAIMTVIQVGCSQRGLATWVQQIVTGTIIVVAVALDRIRSSRA